MTPQENPFRVRKIQPGALPYLFNGEEDCARLQALADEIASKPRSLIVGPHGTGKSTLLHALRPMLQRRFGNIESVQLRSDASSRQNRSVLRSAIVAMSGHCGHEIESDHPANTHASANENLLIVDGIEQLSLGRVFQLGVRVRFQTGVSILATSHRSMARWPVIVHTRAEPSTVRALLSRLVDGLPESAVDDLSRCIQDEDLSNIRDVRKFWFRMYDVAAEAPDSRLPEFA